MKFSITNLVVTLLVALMLLTPAVNVAAPLAFVSLDLYANIVFGFFALLFFFRRRGYAHQAVGVLSCLLLTFIYLIFLEILSGENDTTGLSFTTRSFVTVLTAYGCSALLHSKFGGNAVKIFFNIAIGCALVQGAVLWLSFLFPSIRDLMSLIFLRNLTPGAEHLILLRVPGFVPNGGDGLSMNQALLCMLGLLGVQIFHRDQRYQTGLIILLFLAMIGTSFTGRSGLYLGVISFFALISIFKGGQFDLKYAPLILLPFAAISFILLSSAQNLASLGSALLDEYGYENPLVRLLRGFIDYHATGAYTDETVRTLLTDMVVVPADPLVFLFGNNNFGQLAGAYIGKVDVGVDVPYFRMWNGMGLLGTGFFLTGVYLLPVSNAVLYLKRMRTAAATTVARKNAHNIKYAVVALLIFGLIGHYKMFFLTGRVFLFCLFLLIFLIYMQYRASGSR